MVMGYWSVAILFWQLSIDHIVNVQCKKCGLGKTRLRHPSLPFDSLPYPTRTIRRRVRSANHVTTKGKEVDHNLWVWSTSFPSTKGAPLLGYVHYAHCMGWGSWWLQEMIVKWASSFHITHNIKSFLTSTSLTKRKKAPLPLQESKLR